MIRNKMRAKDKSTEGKEEEEKRVHNNKKMVGVKQEI